MEAVPYLTVPEYGPIQAGSPASLALMLTKHPERWLPRLAYHADRCWSSLLDCAGELEVWLMSWLPGQGTDVHNHGDTCGAFAVARGTLTERLPAAASGSAVIRTLEAGVARVFGPDYTHQLRNTGCVPAVSVHAHAVERCLVPHTLPASRVIGQNWINLANDTT